MFGDTVSLWSRLESSNPGTIEEFSRLIYRHAYETVIVSYSLSYSRKEMRSIEKNYIKCFTHIPNDLKNFINKKLDLEDKKFNKMKLDIEDEELDWETCLKN